MVGSGVDVANAMEAVGEATTVVASGVSEDVTPGVGCDTVSGDVVGVDP
jgi:hypothetical protein